MARGSWRDKSSRTGDGAPVETRHVSEPAAEDDGLSTLSGLNVKSTPAFYPDVATTLGLYAEQQVDRARNGPRGGLDGAVIAATAASGR